MAVLRQDRGAPCGRATRTQLRARRLPCSGEGAGKASCPLHRLLEHSLGRAGPKFVLPCADGGVEQQGEGDGDGTMSKQQHGLISVRFNIAVLGKAINVCKMMNRPWGSRRRVPKAPGALFTQAGRLLLAGGHGHGAPPQPGHPAIDSRVAEPRRHPAITCGWIIRIADGTLKKPSPSSCSPCPLLLPSPSHPSGLLRLSPAMNVTAMPCAPPHP